MLGHGMNQTINFIPERFIGNDVNFLGQDFELIPFGVGRRICVGLPLAKKLIPLVLGALLHQFEWTLPEELKESGIDLTENCGIVERYYINWNQTSGART